MEQKLFMYQNTLSHWFRMKPINAHISQIINRNYQKDCQTLNLKQSAHDWLEIIVHRDWTQLKRLLFNQCQINSYNLNILSELAWPNLRILNLSCNRLESSGIKLLSKTDWPALESLYLSNEIQDEAVRHLMKGQWLRLQFLRLYDNKIGLNGHQYLTICSSNCLNDLSIRAILPIGLLSLFSATKWNTSSKVNGLYYEIRYVGNINNRKIKAHLQAIASDCTNNNDDVNFVNFSCNCRVQFGEIYLINRFILTQQQIMCNISIVNIISIISIWRMKNNGNRYESSNQIFREQCNTYIAKLNEVNYKLKNDKQSVQKQHQTLKRSHQKLIQQHKQKLEQLSIQLALNKQELVKEFTTIINESFEVDLSADTSNYKQKFRKFFIQVFGKLSKINFLVESSIYKEIPLDQKNLVFNSISSISSNKKITSTKTLFEGHANTTFDGWLQKIHEKQNLLVLISLKNGNKICAFSQTPYSSSNSNKSGHGFLMSISNKRLYPLKQKYNGKAITFDEFILKFGNLELLIKSNLRFDVVFGKQFSHFDQGNDTIVDFIGQQTDQGEYNLLEFHQIFFK